MRNLPGFTIVELTMAIVIAIILAGAAVVGLGNIMSGIQLSAATDKLAADLRYAQGLATSYWVWHGVSLEAAPVNRYTLYSTTGTVDSVVNDPARNLDNFIVNVYSIYGVTISGVSIDGGSQVEFNPFGVPYTDKAAAAITAEGVITLARGAATKTVRLVPATGRIYIQ
ncbi:hypothetical protein A2625_00365 [candidate division WOR-1 bacterium RIFCSPHIGHO2_01_FULL_53_15]|uniref:General secretion pathway GspH domain-containing protein n=1 Tax=candidate division WOR-1 bacterium RIFCSPHIGHO2_01_FULL_53_15 TaxID=1802564 RepID=A0A1F4PYZ6_UNCSA|nr:MAG: hypothetical protein A2625_00365 [candidate division WOR-1 bacterium RIFCSPHIGHO2_01_FULL_53_15]OGC10474.1 MAG: hypothetical protein A3D23_03455 [candidate division WOR-1 bacterium RIFCSPHIGHO2_02_FULL_53_26]